MRKECSLILLMTIIVVLSFCAKKTTGPAYELTSPGNVIINLIEDNTIQIEWDYSSNDGITFLIDRKKGVFNWLENYGEVPENLTIFNDSIFTNSDTVYSYRIRAFDGEVFSSYSDTIAWISDNAAPTNLEVEQIVQDTLKLTWQDNSIGEQYFRIDRKIDEKGWQIDYAHVPSDTTHFLDYTTALYDTCHYRIFAVSGISQSHSTENVFIPFLPTPSNLQLEVLNATEVKLTWQDNCHNEEGYRFFFKRGEVAVWDSLDINASTEMFIDENVIPGITQYYKICAYYEEDTSEFVEDNINTLSAPSNLVYQKMNLQTIKLVWKDNSDGEEGFKIDKKVGNQDWQECGEVPANTEQWTDVNADINEVLTYRVYAYYGSFFSDYVETNQINNFLAAPSNFQFEIISQDTVKLTWNDNSNEEQGFKIDRKIENGSWEIEYVTLGENTTEWLDDNVELNNYYYSYRVYAYYDTSISEKISLVAMFAPSNLTYQLLNIHTIKLMWNDNSNGENGFKIDKKISTQEWQEGYASVSENTIEWTDVNTEVNELIMYRVYAYCGSSISHYDSTEYIDTILPAPSNFVSMKIDIKSIKLIWSDNSIGEHGFKIDKKVNSGAWQVEVGITNQNSEQWFDWDAEVNDTLQYRIYAYYGSATSDYLMSNSIYNILPAPTNVAYEIVSQDTVKLTWNDNSIGEQGFKIDKKVGDEAWQNEYKILNGNTTEWIDGDVDLTNTVYSYRIYTYFHAHISSKVEITVQKKLTRF